MKTRYALVGLLALALFVSAVPARAAAAGPGTIGPWDDQAAQTEKFSKTVPLGKTGVVTVTNISGDIIVTGGAGDQVVIDAVKRARTAEALKELQIEVVASSGRVEIATRFPEWTSGRHRNIEGSVDYTITLPRGAEVRLKSVSGDVTVSTVDGELQAETVSGDVKITDAAQLDTAKTVSGDVTVKGASAPASLDVASVSGNVDLTAVKARAIGSSSVSGDLRMTDVTCDRVSAKSVSGDLTFGGPLAKGGRYVLKTHSGTVVVKVTNNAGFEVIASSFSGDIKSDLPLTVKFGGPDEKEGRRRQDIRGTYGDGSASLELNSFSGNIRITGAAAAAPAKK